MSGNLWMLFKNLTNEGGKQLATVVDNIGSNYTVMMQGGNNTTVQSDVSYAVDSKVFIKNGRIVSQAPNLSFIEIEV